jgi:glycosyltransferase involved in cell wall biosynthesis
MMKVSLNCKLDNSGAYGFIKPIADIKEVEEIKVFRDSEAMAGDKIKYYTPRIHRPALLGQISKFFQMLSLVSSEVSVSIGIYEIPHGLLAFLIGKIKKIPTAICIIGNPGYRRIRKGLRKFLMYFMLKRVEAVTVTGNKSKEILVSNGVDPKKIYILPNSFDVRGFLPKGHEKIYDIISLGYLSPEKELVSFLHIINCLRKRIPTIKAGIAGKGPEKEKLERAIVELSLETNVELLGYVDNAAGYYNSGKVFVLTSSTEGLPRTVIEAMACGVPCVVSKVGDIEDLVRSGENGFVVDDYSHTEGFVEKIVLLLSDKNQYNRFSQSAALFAREHYSREAATDVWKKILREICGVNNV